MPTFAGVNHVALSVTDVERSTRFYVDVLGLLVALDLGHGRVLLDRASGFSVALLQHPGGSGDAFSEDTELGHHLNFRDPDGIALELQAPNAVYAGLVAQLASGSVPDEVVRDQAERVLGPGVVAQV